MSMLATTSPHQLDNTHPGPAEPDAETSADVATDTPSTRPAAQAVVPSKPATSATRPAPATPATPATPAGCASPDAHSLERIARLRQRVRQDGADPETVARELGVDPIIAQLWLRLPDDLWPTVPSGGMSALATGAVAPDVALQPARPPLLPAGPTGVLRRVLTCRIPAPAFDRLRHAEGALLDAAATALETGLAQPRPSVTAGGWGFPRRPLAVPIPGEAYNAVLQLAEEAFGGDPRDAAGWLIARGVGFALPLPTPEELAGPPRISAAVSPQDPTPAPVRFVMPPRRRPEMRAPLPADDSAPSGEELRRRRDAAGLSQRDLAAAAGLSRGLVAEIERGRRRHVLSRLKLAETLAAVEQRRAAATE